MKAHIYTKWENVQLQRNSSNLSTFDLPRINIINHFQLLIQTHESQGGNFGSCGFESQEIYSVKLYHFKVDKRNMKFGMFSSIPLLNST